MRYIVMLIIRVAVFVYVHFFSKQKLLLSGVFQASYLGRLLNAHLLECNPIQFHFTLAIVNFTLLDTIIY